MEIVPNLLKRLICTCKWTSNYFRDYWCRFGEYSGESEFGKFWTTVVDRFVWIKLDKPNFVWFLVGRAIVAHSAIFDNLPHPSPPSSHPSSHDHIVRRIAQCQCSNVRAGFGNAMSVVDSETRCQGWHWKRDVRAGLDNAMSGLDLETRR